MVQRAERMGADRRRATSGRPVGNITRGTTNPNRLRRVDRWLAGPQAWRLRTSAEPMVVDLGYGASPTTAVELFGRLRTVSPGVQVAGIEIEPERVRVAKALERPGLSFLLGGFELPVPGRPVMVRAFNVLRQYDEADVPAIWNTVTSRLAPAGIFVDGTCDEVGRRSTWVALDGGGPISLTLSLRFGDLELPSDLAERLPKTLIHRNTPGNRIHTFLQAFDRCWLQHAPLAAYGRRQRWIAACGSLRAEGWPVLDGPSRWRLGEITVAWSAVEP